MKYELTIQEKLKDLRVENGLSLEQLADATGISKSALSSYEVVENREISSFVKKLCPDDCNLQAETLKRISIEEDAFFEHTLSEDIVRIMREIRQGILAISKVRRILPLLTEWLQPLMKWQDLKEHH